ncbi:MAG: transcription termination factor NusA [Candidatus Eisenbacteria bacterium]|nr:transcription termination factor NusA [Candidatus Eisenbacteria bacterium]
MSYEIIEALGEIAREKSVNMAIIIETLEAGLLSAAKKKYGSSANIEVKIDETKGVILMTAKKKVVEKVEDPMAEIRLEEAKAISPETQVGELVSIALPVAEFGRNAIQAAKQVLIQKVREAERERIFKEYQEKIGRLVRGQAQQIDRGNVIVKLEKTEAILPSRELVGKERYRQGDYVRAIVCSVDKSAKLPQVTLSRTHPDFLKRLFESEVPEITEGIVEVKGVAREPGSRSKISVLSHDEKVDPVGACVGIKGSRVQSIVRELGGERIDIVPWSHDPVVFVTRALSPAKVLQAKHEETENRVYVVVPDDQLSLAIGKGGQNVRLAMKLCGAKIDLVSKSEHDKRTEPEKAEAIDIEKIDGISEKLAAKLKDAGIKTGEDLVKAGIEGLTSIQGIGEKTANKLLELAGQMTAEAEEEKPETADSEESTAEESSLQEEEEI